VPSAGKPLEINRYLSADGHLLAPYNCSVRSRDQFAPGRDIMKQLDLLGLTAIGMLFFCGGSISKADELLKFRLIMHTTSVQTQEVGDVDGHVVGVGRYSGLASFPDGSVGTANFTFTIDYVKGVGTYSTYYNVTLKDGSSLWIKGTGPAKPDGATTVFPETPVNVLRGTGRFEGAKGEGTSMGARLTPLSVGAELYNDFTINVKK
jgi:hypothetical protein